MIREILGLSETRSHSNMPKFEGEKDEIRRECFSSSSLFSWGSRRKENLTTYFAMLGVRRERQSSPRY